MSVTLDEDPKIDRPEIASQFELCQTAPQDFKFSKANKHHEQKTEDLPPIPPYENFTTFLEGQAKLSGTAGTQPATVKLKDVFPTKAKKKLFSPRGKFLTIIQINNNHDRYATITQKTSLKNKGLNSLLNKTKYNAQSIAPKI